MKIGIDIDNTISRTSDVILNYARIFGRENGLNIIPDPSHYYIEDALGWPKEAVKNFFDRNLLEIYTHVEPLEMALEVLNEWSSIHYLALITSRNKLLPGIEEATRRWLDRHRVPHDLLIMNTTGNMHYFSKLQACLDYGIEVMIEDHHDLAQEISQSMPVLLFTYPYNQHVSGSNIQRVNNWLEVRGLIANWSTNIGDRALYLPRVRQHGREV